MRAKKWIIFYVFVFFISSGHSFWPFKKQAREDIIISHDTTWSGKLKIEQVVLIKKGARLTIKPGTELIFSRGDRPGVTDDVHIIQGGGIKVEGKIVAVGTADNPIVFTGMEKSPGGWGNIYLSYSQDNIFTYCIFEYANFAIHSHFSSLTISHSLFENNNEGCRLGFSEGLIKNNIFRLNKSRGINFKAGKNDIKNNSITANHVGIFIPEKGDQAKIVFNNIFNNKKYNLQLGDFHREDVNAPKNFWGKEIDYDKFIYDKKDDEKLGDVGFLPVAEEKICWGDEDVVRKWRVKSKE
ncbi:MAG: NosD domain-containing protein [bacterium]